MKFKLQLKSKYKSLSIYTTKKEIVIRYWGKLKFDVITIYPDK
jgi:hypothetical protein